MATKTFLKLKDQVIRQRFRDKGQQAVFPEFLVCSNDILQALIEDGTNTTYSDGLNHLFGGNVCLILYNEITYYKWFYQHQLESGECDESIKSVYTAYQSSRGNQSVSFSTGDSSDPCDTA